MTTTHWRAEWPEVPAEVKVAALQMQRALRRWEGVERTQITFDHLHGEHPPTFDLIGTSDQATTRRLRQDGGPG